MNKKIIYLSVFLVIALFLISACNEAVGRRTVKDSENIKTINTEDLYNLKVGQNATVNDVTTTLIDVGFGGNVIVNEKVIESGKTSTISSQYASVDVTNLESFYNEIKSKRSAKLKIVKSSPENLPGHRYDLTVGNGITLKNIELVDVGSGGGVIVSVNAFSLSSYGGTLKITDEVAIKLGETKIINNFVVKNVKASYHEIKSKRSATLEIRQL